MGCSLLAPPAYNNLVHGSYWLWRRGVHSWTVLVLGEVPADGKALWVVGCPAVPCASVGCCRASPPLALVLDYAPCGAIMC